MTSPSTSPFLSVIVITYNHGEFIGEALASVLAQDFDGPWEVIVADDGSTDDTRERAEAVAQIHPHVRVLEAEPNLGAQRNLRRALANISGELVALLEGDDFWTDASKLRRQVAHLQQRPTVAAVAHRTTIHASDGKERQLPPLPPHLTKREAVLGPRPHFSSLLYRRTTLPTTPTWFDTYLAADSLMCAIIAEQGGIDVIDRDMSAYRISDDSMWRPLPPLRRRLDAIGRLEAIDEHTDILSHELRRQAFRQNYGHLYSGIARTRPLRTVAKNLGDVLLRDPRRATSNLGWWVIDQTKHRLRPIQ